MSKPLIAILCGSDSDLPVIQSCTKVLDEFKVSYDIRVLSAHRTAAALDEYLKSIEGKTVKVIIAAAGMAAHLAGSVAAKTTVPVIGIPIAVPPFDGLDSLLSTAQMPPGIPVMTVAVGKPGATNAALAAIQILATSKADLKRKLKIHRKKMAEKVLEKNEELKKSGINEYVRKNLAK